jgi:3-hexulose-6-phosphate synthase
VSISGIQLKLVPFFNKKVIFLPLGKTGKRKMSYLNFAEKAQKNTHKQYHFIGNFYKFPAMKPIVQISLDLTNIDEALETAALAMRAGVDWLEAGTPLILAEGLHGVRKLRAAFPGVPIVADLKTMDGGYLEVEMMAKAGATHVVVMARAHEETIKCCVQAGRDFGVKVMGDNMVCPDMVAGARWLEDLGCDYVIHHIGYDERRGIAAEGKRMPSPLDQLREVVQAVHIPVQAVGGLSLEQAIRCPEYGAPLVVLGAPLTIDADSFKTASGDLESSLRLICQKIHAYGEVPVAGA